MKIFPTKTYSITFSKEKSLALNELQKSTLSEEQFVSDWHKYVFIGKIKDSKFELKLSKKIYGGFYILKGTLKKNNGILELKINKSLKIASSLLVLLSIITLTTSLIKTSIENSLKISFQTIIYIVVLRFILLEYILHIIAKNYLRELTKIIGIKNTKLIK